jgi:2-hydroxy-3-keto-5-methylthiopentenyl-1-phosphate phosphatase
MISFYSSTHAVCGKFCVQRIAALKKLLAHPRCNLVVVSDFDHTLTNFSSLQCHDVVGYHKEYTDEFIKEFNAIFHAPKLCYSTWWREAHDLLAAKSGLTESMLTDRLEESRINVRTGLSTFVKFLRDVKIPLVVVSAGIREVIKHTLVRNGLNVENDELFHIDANYFEFHDSGKLADILPVDPVHSLSKKHATSRVPHMFQFLNPVNSDTTASTFTPSSNHDHDRSNIDAILAAAERMSRADDACNAHDASDGEATSHNATGGVSNPENSTTGAMIDTVAIVLGDRPADFAVFEAHPQVATLRVGFARSQGSAGGAVDELLLGGGCDVVLVGELHGLEAVHDMLLDLLELRTTTTATTTAATFTATIVTTIGTSTSTNSTVECNSSCANDGSAT